MNTSRMLSDEDFASAIHTAARTRTRPQLRVAVVCGGTSSEAEVSRNSATEVIAALKTKGHDAFSLELGVDVFGQLSSHTPDVVFPVLHGGAGEDGSFQGALEIMGLPYVGSSVEASCLAMHKPRAKLVFADAGLPIVPGTALPARDYSASDIANLLKTYGPEVVIKPSSEGSALGVTFCSQPEPLLTLLQDAQASSRRLMLERRIVGKEVTVGVLEVDDALFAFTPIEIRTPEHTWYDFEHRYAVGGSQHVIPASLDRGVLDALRNIALRAHQALGCRHLSRADFIVTAEGEPFLLEVNTLPGMTKTSLFPDGAAHAGVDFPTLVDHLAQSALMVMI